MISAQLPPKKWRVATVNPWALSDPASVVAEVITALSACFPDESTSFGKSLRFALAKYGALATPALAFVPIAGAGS